VAVLPVSTQGCIGDKNVLPVEVQVQLRPHLPIGPDSVCINDLGGNYYSTSSTTGSVYTWFSEGGSFGTSQGLPDISVDWQGTGQYKLWVMEENQTCTHFCAGFSDTLLVTVFEDLSSIRLEVVGVRLNNDQLVEMAWQIGDWKRLELPIRVLRRLKGDIQWEEIAVLGHIGYDFTDDGARTEQYIYEYKIEGANKCGEMLETLLHNTLLLTGGRLEDSNLIALTWNDYLNWPQGVEDYEIWRELDNNGGFELLDVADGATTAYVGNLAQDGFVHRYRVLAKERNGANFSWSNLLLLEFAHRLVFPNVITPNGDGANDYLVVPKLHLYPDNELKIFNRHGTMVYNVQGYNNDWDGSGLTAGVYFYYFITTNNNVRLKGWIEVMK